MVSSESNGKKSIAVLGSTGSIGKQTLDIVRLFPDRFDVCVLTSGSATDVLAEQAREFRPDVVVLANGANEDILIDQLSDLPVRVMTGPEALIEAAAWPVSDIVVTALVGSAGLRPTVAAMQCGKRIALANKETLVVAGSIIRPMVVKYNAEIIPVDSEHSAIFQCLVGESADTIEKLTLTSSGGPFRERSLDTFSTITREEALAHPIWTMGPKITIDSATMMNKGLEVLEAHWLFDVGAENIDVVVHPQSIIHSMVTFVDGSAKAQLGVPDMKVPIQYALCYPDRWPADHARIDWTDLPILEFHTPDWDRFPCLGLAFEALRMGGATPAVLNAANEEAVALFLQDQMRFTDIPVLIERVMVELDDEDSVTIDDLMHADLRARRRIQELANAGVH